MANYWEVTLIVSDEYIRDQCEPATRNEIETNFISDFEINKSTAKELTEDEFKEKIK